MRFVIDAQLPPGLGERLRSLGHEAAHVREIGLAAAEDSDIWRHVCDRGCVLVTKDQDFLALAKAEPTGAPVVWIRLGNTTNRALWAALQPLLKEVVEALEQSERVVEIT
ncbi:MAG: hypothetical protein BroJett030_21430 [Alphaproteobacteria bacterium]|nr:MAG: hypothetical protein BroJett030_21430 [Alphaproteobacteria bacterium]